MYKKIIFIFLAITLLFSENNTSISNFKFEQPLTGKLISQKTLDKYVTIVYIWSASKRIAFSNTPQVNDPTYASMSRDDLKTLAKEYDKLYKKGLRVVASHQKFRNSRLTEMEVGQTIPEDVRFPVYFQFRNRIYTAGASAPYIYVFDVGGKVAYQGKQVRRGIDVAEELLQTYPQKRVGEITTKFFRSELRNILNDRKLGRAYKKISKSIKNDDPEKEKEGKILLQKLESMFETDIEELNASKVYDPTTYVIEGRILAKKWKGFSKGDDLKKSIDKLMRTKGFKRSIKAQEIYNKARKVYFSMELPTNAKASFSNKEFVKDNRRNIKNLEAYCKYIKKSYGKTIFAVWANDMLKKIRSS